MGRDEKDELSGELLVRTSSRRRRSGWLGGCWGSCWCAAPPGWIAGRIVEVEAYLGPHRRQADPQHIRIAD